MEMANRARLLRQHKKISNTIDTASNNNAFGGKSTEFIQSIRALLNHKQNYENKKNGNHTFTNFIIYAKK